MSDQTTNLSIILSAKDQISGVLGNLKGAFSGFGSGIDSAKGKLDGLGASTASSSRALELAGGIAAGAVTAGIVVLGVHAIKTAANFQTLTTTLVTSAGESKKNLDMIKSGILSVSSATGTSAESLSKAMYLIESSGKHGADGLLVLKAAAQGAKAENADVATVADAVSSALVDYHLRASDAGEVTSKLITAVSQGKTTFQELAGSLHSVLPLASAAHVSLSDVTAAIASMTVHGMGADQASQNLAESIRKMMAPTQSMTTELASLGINSADLAGKLGKEGITGTLEDLSKAILQKMGPSGKVLLNTFNQSQIAAEDVKKEMAALPKSLQSVAESYLKGGITVQAYRKEIKSLPVDQGNLMQQFASLVNRSNGFNQSLKTGLNTNQSYTQALQRATGDATTFNTALMLTGENASYVSGAVKAVSGATTEAGGNVKGWAEIQSTFNSKMDQAKNSIHNTGIAIGSALLPALTSFLKVVTNLLIPFAEWVSKHQQLAAILLTAIAAITATTAATLIMRSAFSKVGEAINILRGGFGKLAGAELVEAKAGMASVATESEAAAGSIAGSGEKSLIGAMSMIGPEGLLAGAAIAGVTALMVTHWSAVKKGVGDAVDGIKNFLGMKTDKSVNVTTNNKTNTTGTSAKAPAAAVGGAAASMKAAQDKIITANATLITQESQMVTLRSQLDAATGKYNSASNKLADDILKYGANNWRVAKDIQAVQQAHEGVAKAQDAVNKKNGEISKSSSLLNKLQGDQARTLQGLQKSIDALPAAHDRLRSAQQKLSDATDTVNQKATAYTASLKLFGPSQDSTKKAFKDLTQSLKDQADAQDGVKKASDNQAKALANAKTWTDNHSDAIKKLGLSHSQTQQLVNALNGDIGRITEAHKTAKKHADDHKASIDNLGNAHDVAAGKIKNLNDKAGGSIGLFDAARGKADGHAGSIGGVGRAADITKPKVDNLNSSLDHTNSSKGGGFLGSLKNIFHFASGVQNFGGGLAIVGEQGPELVNLPAGSDVYTNPATNTILNRAAQPVSGFSGGGQNVTLNVNVGTYAGQPGELNQLATTIWQQIQVIARQHGQANALPQIGIRPV